MRRLSRRSALRAGLPVTLAVVGAGRTVAEPIDGKGNDVCPCFFGVDRAVLVSEETIEVSGPCAVASPPELVTVRVQVRGARGARAAGRTTFECTGSEGDRETFSVPAAVRGPPQFDTGDRVTVRAMVRIAPEDDPTVVGRWDWSGVLG